MAAVLHELAEHAEVRWTGRVRPTLNGAPDADCQLQCEASDLPEICNWLFSERHYSFGGLVVEQRQRWELRYLFYGEGKEGWVHVVTYLPESGERIPSIAKLVHAADWHEREAEDAFGLVFEGHPRLGDFVLHNDVWHEGVAPMRRAFDGSRPVTHREPDLNWKPRRIVEEAGAFAMPVGPLYSVATAPVYFQLETVGEDVIRAQPRLFYAYRGLEKIAEGRRAEDVLLIAERISATSAFAHSLAFCQAVERLSDVEVPERASSLRIFLAELERLRHHVAAIEGICESTGLTVAAAQAGILQEDLLRISGRLTGHRYLFGLNAFGGLAMELTDAACASAANGVSDVAQRLATLQSMLSTSSSFLDRLEDVGDVSKSDAVDFGLVGPVARASGLARDLRKAQPYCGYEKIDFRIPQESEGDGYARLRVFFREAEQSARVVSNLARAIPPGPYRRPQVSLRPGAALGWVEAPNGAAMHWLRLGEAGRVDRYRIVTPSFANWHGFRLAAENFAFQDFPIILATFALSVHENDR
ncbi:MAG TPA: NADH-quinone oxidoreductase subunit C [Candidatus Binataceae bacterium]|nr:NADH-quinone oxidoreductase subunit C [Candidatus Binataceae bacterium]